MQNVSADALGTKYIVQLHYMIRYFGNYELSEGSTLFILWITLNKELR